MTNPCWTSEDDENLKPTCHFDEGHYPHSIQNKPAINSPRLHSKPSVDYLLRDRRANARNGYTVQCDLMMGLWRDGLSYMRAVELACEWLARFNRLNGIEECVC